MTDKKTSGLAEAPPQTGDTFVPLKLESFLPYRLNVLAEIVSQSLARYYQERHGISIPEWRIIATLGQYSSMTAKDIGTHSHMHKTKVSRAVSALERKGMLERAVNEKDHREAFLVLSDHGRTVYTDLVPVAHNYCDTLTAELDTDERAQLDQLIRRLCKRAKTLAIDS